MMNPTTVMVDEGKEHAKTEDPHEDVGKLKKDRDKAIVMIKPLQQTKKSHEDSSEDGGTNPARIWHEQEIRNKKIEETKINRLGGIYNQTSKQKERKATEGSREIASIASLLLIVYKNRAHNGYKFYVLFHFLERKKSFRLEPQPQPQLSTGKPL
ncbi:hypothetical protein Tco_0811622 [Tanacetum coccineum]